jgi:transcriptional regulator with XRE-family HTH domain
MESPASILRDARREAGLSQLQLAHRLGVSQAAVAKLEHPHSNPTVRTLARALRATGRHLSLETTVWQPGVDESLIRRQLELTPLQRVRDIEAMYTHVRHLTRAGQVSRGESA